MKQLILIIIAGGLLVFIVSLFRTHKSGLKHETGTVVEKQFSPVFDGNGSGVGISTGGHMVVTSNHVHKDAQYILVFKCQHSHVFTIDDIDVYSRLEKGDSVNISYYEILDKDNELVDFDFVNAVKQ